jgi:hypothetical protein
MLFLAIACMATVCSFAQSFRPARMVNPPMRSQMIMTGGTQYNSTVYEPFSNNVPSEQNASENGSPARAPRRAFDAEGNWVPDSDDFGSGAETGGAVENFPLGEPWALLLMAAAFGTVIHIRNRKAVKE